MAALKSDENFMKTLKSIEQGAATQVWAAAAPVWEGTGGKYLEDLAIAKPSTDSAFLPGGGHGAHAYDPAMEERLWKLSLELANVVAP